MTFAELGKIPEGSQTNITYRLALSPESLTVCGSIQPKKVGDRTITVVPASAVNNLTELEITGDAPGGTLRVAG